jgi:dienelactone hydrolase
MLRLEDPSRGYGTIPKRPIQVSLWQPVQIGTGPFPSLPLAAYVIAYMAPLTADMRTPGNPSQAMKQFQNEWFPKAPTAAVNQLLETRNFACRDAPPAAGKFPLVVYAPGYGDSPLSHIATAEFLASHGYVVAMSPSQGEAPSGMTFDTAGQEQQIRDMEFTAGALRARPNIDPDKIALVGFSFGGGAAVVAGTQMPGVAAVVSLGGTLTFDHTLDFLRGSLGYDPAAFRVPLLVLKAEDPHEDLSIVRSLALSNRQVIRFRGVHHDDFIPASILRSKVDKKPNPSGRAFAIVGNTLLRFLDEHVKGGEEDIHNYFRSEELTSGQAGDPSSEMLLTKVDAPSRQELISAALDETNVEKLLNAQQALSKKAPGLALLNGGTLHMLGMKLMERDQKDKAIQVYQLLVTLYPRDFLAMNQLGDLHREKNEAAKASRYYRQSLATKSANQAAVEGLEALKKAGGQ